jgi:hypothetical protein
MSGLSEADPAGHGALALPLFESTPVMSFVEVHPLFTELNAQMRLYDAQPADPIRTHSMGRHGFVPELEQFAKRFMDEGEHHHALTVLDEGLRAVGGWRVIDGRHYQKLAKAAAEGGQSDFALTLVRNEARFMARLWGGPDERVRAAASPVENFGYRIVWVGAASEVLRAATEQQAEVRPWLYGATIGRIRRSITGMRQVLPAVSKATSNWDSNGVYTHAIATAYDNLKIVAAAHNDMLLMLNAEQLLLLALRLDPASLGVSGMRGVVKKP